MTSNVVAPSRGGNRVWTADEVLAHLTQHVRVDEKGCHIWAGSVTTRRLPVVMWDSKRHNARRLLVQLSGRTIPAGHVVYTACGTHLCCHLDHLRVGSKKQANRAHVRSNPYGGTPHSIAVAAGRAANAKMPASERWNVARMRANGWIWARIAEHYNVHPTAPQKQWKAWERAYGASAFWRLAA